MNADYIMVGGFLGAGKTTALLRLAEHLTAQGRRVGLITNDQSNGLVDTTLVGSHGYPVQEITGGCFCCRFNSLVAAAERLTDEAKPDVFLAEPVGSCTDLRATVQYPLQTSVRRPLPHRAAQRARGSRSGAARPGTRAGPGIFAKGPLRVRQTARRGRDHRHQQGRPPVAGATGPTGSSARSGLSPAERAFGERTHRSRAGSLVCEDRGEPSPTRGRRRRWTTTRTPRAKRSSAGSTARFTSRRATPFDGNRLAAHPGESRQAAAGGRVDRDRAFQDDPDAGRWPRRPRRAESCQLRPGVRAVAQRCRTISIQAS